MKIEDIARSLEGATHADVKRLANEYFTPGFLDGYASTLMNVIRMTEESGLGITYHPSEFDKCIIHYCVRELIDELWKFSTPQIRQHIDSDGRFRLDETLADGKYGKLTQDIPHNLDVGKTIILDITNNEYKRWVRNLEQKHRLNPQDLISLMFAVYKLHSVLINGGDWETPTIMHTTFTSAGREAFDWLVDYPNLSRVEFEAIAQSLVRLNILQASQLGIKSTAKEQVTEDLVNRGELAYVYNPGLKSIIFNPMFAEDVVRVEDEIREHYYDQTRLVLGCPAMFANTSLYRDKSMLHDLVRFRSSVYEEIYLATHNRR